MGIEIPDRWMGKPIEGSLERIMNKQAQSPITTSPTQSQRQIIVPANINPRDYIIVPQYNVLIAKSETHKGKNYDETLDALAQEGLMMPTIAQFMRHWMNVKAAADGIKVLLYADKTSVLVQEAADLWKYISSGHRGGCYTWLNARFSENGGNWKMIQEYRGTPLQKLEIPFNCSVRENDLVALEFNNEGFPERRSGLNSYSAGKNIFFYDPRDGRVAWFGAGSGGAVLGCDRYPAVRGSSLGVFACAAGSAPKNSGGNS